MTNSTAKSLADSALAALKLSGAHGIETPDADTKVAKTVYVGPLGSGYEVRVTQKGVVNDVVTVRHDGPETYRDAADKTFAELKAEALATLASRWAKTIATGFVDSALGKTIAITESARVELDQLASHLIRKESADTDMTAIPDISGLPLPLTVAQFRALIIRLGDYYQTKRYESAVLAAQVNAATDIDGLLK